MLLVVAATGAVLASIGELASHAMQREKEKQLLFAGQQYREAIASYYNRTPGAVKRYPGSLAELLEDKRFPVPQRHLRRLYPDPVTGQAFAAVPSPEGGIMGVQSASGAAPVKTANFLLRDADFTDTAKYSDWKFVYAPGAR
jgi:type II secretory pathway pseudopilin PulG